jgi:hypothetical protein
MYEYSAQWKPPLPQPPRCTAQWHLPAAIDVASLGVYKNYIVQKNPNFNLKITALIH